MLIVQAVMVSFVAAAGFGVLFNVPKKTIAAGGIAGMAGWVLYQGLAVGYEMNQILATAIASFVVAMISQLFARVLKMPVIVFSVSGIIPLVPGGLAYNTMRHLVGNDFFAATELASQVFLISGAIAFGLVLASVIAQVLLRRGPGARI
ncbi:MAG TPA: threonine/serine exporter family protein [Bacillales bacterium]|nr:threonine/serine exporter family protein [Bacillales bacterium]